MTLEEAKKILKKEGFSLEGPGRKSCTVGEAFTEYESPEVCEAMQIVCSAGYMIKMFGGAFNARKARLKKEYEKETKAPGPGEVQPNESNPALKEAASQFYDALLDEQAKKIEKLTKENEDWKSWHELQNRAIAINNIVFRDEKNRLGKEIARLNKIIHKKNMKIEEMRKESSRHLRGKIKVFYENVDLEGKLKDKDAVLSDVAEELRLSKIREKNLTELCQKYIKANEELKEKLADNVVDKIDAQALKSAESALAWKEKVIYYKDMAIACYEKKIAEKDEELTESKKMVEWVRNASKEYCDYGVAANEFIKELAGLYVLASNKNVFEIEMVERCKNYQTYGFPANCNRETKKEIDNIAEEGADQPATIVQCDKGITLSKEEIEIIEYCTKNGVDLHYNKEDGFTYTNVFDDEVPIIHLYSQIEHKLWQ